MTSELNLKNLLSKKTPLEITSGFIQSFFDKNPTIEQQAKSLLNLVNLDIERNIFNTSDFIVKFFENLHKQSSSLDLVKKERGEFFYHFLKHANFQSSKDLNAVHLFIFEDFMSFNKAVLKEQFLVDLVVKNPFNYLILNKIIPSLLDKNFFQILRNSEICKGLGLSLNFTSKDNFDISLAKTILNLSLDIKNLDFQEYKFVSFNFLLSLFDGDLNKIKDFILKNPRYIHTLSFISLRDENRNNFLKLLKSNKEDFLFVKNNYSEWFKEAVDFLDEKTIKENNDRNYLLTFINREHNPLKTFFKFISYQHKLFTKEECLNHIYYVLEKPSVKNLMFFKTKFQSSFIVDYIECFTDLYIKDYLKEHNLTKKELLKILFDDLNLIFDKNPLALSSSLSCLEYSLSTSEFFEKENRHLYLPLLEKVFYFQNQQKHNQSNVKFNLNFLFDSDTELEKLYQKIQSQFEQDLLHQIKPQQKENDVLETEEEKIQKYNNLLILKALNIVD